MNKTTVKLFGIARNYMPEVAHYMCIGPFVVLCQSFPVTHFSWYLVQIPDLLSPFCPMINLIDVFAHVLSFLKNVVADFPFNSSL